MLRSFRRKQNASASSQASVPGASTAETSNPTRGAAAMQPEASFTALLTMAERVMAENLDDNEAYDLYHEMSLGNGDTEALDDQQGGLLIEILDILHRENRQGLRVFPQSDQRQSPGRYFQKDSEAALDENFYRILRPSRESNETKARLNIAVKPAGLLKLPTLFDYLIKNVRGIAQTKIAGPRAFADRAESAVIYLRSRDWNLAKRIANSIYQQLGEELLDDKVPVGMASVCRGVSYTAIAKGDSGSAGLDRVRVIREALQRVEKSQGKAGKALTLAQALGKALKNRGYRKDNPAFLH